MTVLSHAHAQVLIFHLRIVLAHAHILTCGIAAETSVFANELKKDNFCLVSMDPGWVDTDMGGSNARRLGMEKAPTDARYSISTMLKTIKQLSVKDSGEFVGIDGKKMDY